MKLKIFTLMLAFVLAAACFTSCQNDGGANKESDSLGSGEASDSLTTGEPTGAITGGTDSIPAVEKGRLSVEGEVKDGKLIAKIYLSENPGIAGCFVKLGFDNTKLRPSAIMESEIIDPSTVICPINNPKIDKSALEVVELMYFNPTNFSKNGLLFSVEFDLLDGATGETELTLISEDGDITNEDLASVICELKGCKISLG